MGDNKEEDLRRKAGIWKTRAVVVARVLDEQSASEPGYATIRLRPLAVVSGKFDGGVCPSLNLRLWTGGQNYTSAGEDYLIELRWSRAMHQYEPVYRASSLSPPWPLLFSRIHGLSSAEIKETLAGIRQQREGQAELTTEEKPNASDKGFWSSHSLIVGSLGEREQVASGGAFIDTIQMRPIMSLAGSFDPGLYPKLAPAYDPDFFKEPRRPPSEATAALILLTRTANTWAIASEATEFMPGDHGPICDLKDLDDEKIGKTLAAVQAMRKDEYSVKPPRFPLIGKTASISTGMSPEAIVVRFLSETSAEVHGKPAGLTRFGDSFAAFYKDESLSVLGTVEGDKITGILLHNGHETPITGTLR
jgi:hypothetical protein